MKNSKVVKIILIMLIGFIILLCSKSAMAVSNFTDLTDTLDGNNTTSSLTGGNNTTNNTANTANNTTNNTTNNVLKTNNTSNYNNSALPSTGLESSMPAIILVVVFAISAVYAYKKTSDYKNI